MDVSLARTFLTVAETGSFIDAGRKMNITQSTVSARIKGLEDLLGKPLFTRSKHGAELTGAGELFQKHALAIVRVWQQAQLQVSLADQHPEHISIGAPLSLWQGFLLKWVSELRTEVPGLAISGAADDAATLMQKLIGGTLDIAILYRPSPPPGLTMEYLFDEAFVLVSSAKPGGRRGANDYALIDWGSDFLQDHAAAFPELANPALNLDLGPMSLEYVVANQCSAYFPSRMVRQHVARGRLRQPKRGRKFVYPVYMVYAETRNEESFEPLLERLRRGAGRFA